MIFYDKIVLFQCGYKVAEFNIKKFSYCDLVDAAIVAIDITSNHNTNSHLISYLLHPR